MEKSPSGHAMPENNGKGQSVKIDMISQVENYLTTHYSFRRNAVLGRTDVKGRNFGEWKCLDDRGFNSILSEMIKAGIKANSKTLWTVINSSYVPEFDPFVDYYNGLADWDGIDYIGQLADTLETSDKELFRIALQKWIVGTVANHVDENSVNQTVLIIQGGQGIGKTRWLNSLIPPLLKKYVYAGRVNSDNKDTLIQLAECGYILMDELASLRRNEIEGFKEIVTQGIIRTRRSYGQFHENMIRRASFMGTTNNHEFLVDSTGNRRFLIFPASQIDHNHKINMDMVYAQAYQLYKDGYEFWFSEDEVKLFAAHNKQFEQKSLEEDLILKELEQCNADETQDFMTATDVCQYLRDRNYKIALTNATTQRVGQAMIKLGFQRVKRAGRNCYAVKTKNEYGMDLMQ